MVIQKWNWQNYLVKNNKNYNDNKELLDLLTIVPLYCLFGLQVCRLIPIKNNIIEK